MKIIAKSETIINPGYFHLGYISASNKNLTPSPGAQTQGGEVPGVKPQDITKGQTPATQNNTNSSQPSQGTSVSQVTTATTTVKGPLGKAKLQEFMGSYTASILGAVFVVVLGTAAVIRFKRKNAS